MQNPVRFLGMIWRSLVLAGGLELAYFFARPAAAADITVLRDVIYLKGTIVPGDSDRLVALAKPLVRPDTDFVLDVDSAGGDAKAGFDLAIVVSLNRIPVKVDFGSVCYSSCFSMFAAAPRRVVSGPARIGVHQPRRAGGASDPAATNRLVDLYRKLGVSQSILDKVAGTSSADIALLTEDEMRSLGPLEYNLFDRQDVALRLVVESLKNAPPALLPSKAGMAAREDAIVKAMPPIGSAAFWDWYDAELEEADNSAGH